MWKLALAPQCEGVGEILDGVYDAVGQSIRATLTSYEQINRLVNLKAALTAAQKTNASPEQVKEAITQQAPEFQKLADSVPKTSLALAGYIKVVLAALTLVLGYLTYMESRKQHCVNQTVVCHYKLFHLATPFWPDSKVRTVKGL